MPIKANVDEMLPEVAAVELLLARQLRASGQPALVNNLLFCRYVCMCFSLTDLISNSIRSDIYPIVRADGEISVNCSISHTPWGFQGCSISSILSAFHSLLSVLVKNESI